MSFRHGFAIPLALLLSLQIFSVHCANCNKGQPRKAGDPSGQQISDALLKASNGDNILDTVCGGQFPPTNFHISTWNTASMIYNITRDDDSKPYDGNQCKGAFQNIIDQCITGDNYWGGDWELPGIYYAIYNSQWPAHTLPSDLNPSGGGGNTPSGLTTIVTVFHGSTITETVRFTPRETPIADY